MARFSPVGGKPRRTALLAGVLGIAVLAVLLALQLVSRVESPEKTTLGVPQASAIWQAVSDAAAVAAGGGSDAAAAPQQLPGGTAGLQPGQLAHADGLAENTAGCVTNSLDGSKYKKETVQRAFKYETLLPPRYVQRGLHSFGDMARLRIFTDKLLSGQPVSVSAVGGSVTAGQGGEAGEGYMPRFWAWIREVSPHAEHTLKHGAFGGSQSGIFSICVHDIIQSDADLVIVEFAVNDDHVPSGDFRSASRLGFERLLRKLLEFPNRPAVLLLNHYAWPKSLAEGVKNNETDLANFAHSAENDFVVFVHAVAKGNKNMTGFEDLFYFDYVHPRDPTGHRVLADLVISLVKQAATDLAVRPLGEEDVEVAQEPLPPPMIPGNYQRKTSTCLLQLHFEKVVVAQQGFEWRSERKAEGFANKKYGWISDQPGSWAELEVDTTTDQQGSLRQNTSDVSISHLRSYEHMGKAKVECIDGCQCDATEFDGFWEKKASLTELHKFQTTQHPQCRLRVTVLTGSSSPDGGTKVKLEGIMVADGAGVLGSANGGQVEYFANRGDASVIVYRSPPQPPAAQTVEPSAVETPEKELEPDQHEPDQHEPDRTEPNDSTE